MMLLFSNSNAQKLEKKEGTKRTSLERLKMRHQLVDLDQQKKAIKFLPQSLGPLERKIFKYHTNILEWNEHQVPKRIELNEPISDHGSKYDLANQWMVRLQETYGNKNIQNVQWKLEKDEADVFNGHHYFYRQYYHNIPIYNNEAYLHDDGKRFYLWNGQWTLLNSEIDIRPNISRTECMEGIKDWARMIYREHFDLSSEDFIYIPKEVNSPELMIYFKDQNPFLVWKVSYMPNLHKRWEVFMDAYSGRILDAFSNVCSMHHHCESSPPPNVTSGRDLSGTVRALNTYSISGTSYMIDASRPMFNAGASNLPNDPIGAIWTLDARGGFPASSGFNPDHLTTGGSSWNNEVAVSAHYNAGQAYEYFANTFGRNSIDGNGGTIISFIDVREQNGQEMDNAFWNGRAMFYGNGDFAFSQPLARSLDVAGHEMSHGVIQNEANLEYRNESGALNESFADVFGSMIDRDDWLIGEEVVNSAVFPSGALRSMEDPHNGGRSLNDAGYQPRHYNERYTGTDDNGGVHINSGIPNFAFFKIATAIGKDKAERIFYRALTVGYLTKSSQFIDFRAAIAQAAADLYSSSEVDACHRACDEVGIPGSPGSGTTDYENDLPINPGIEYLVATDENQQDLYLLDAVDSYVMSNTGPGSKPSLTDNGQTAFYIGQDDRMYGVDIDYSGSIPSFNDYLLQGDPDWGYVAISKDGSKLAAVSNIAENIIYVYDFVSEQWELFELFNPSYTQGIETGEVQYADVLEWDYNGEYLMYDAFNELQSPEGEDISYWDIGFIRVWDNARNTFSDGSEIEKLFTSLPENISIGNPTFSKNSPYIIAFDVIDNNDNSNFLVGANIESGQTNTIASGDVLFYPSYSIQDNYMVYEQDGFGFDSYDLKAITLGSDKISAAGNEQTIVNAARWGVLVGNGARDFTSNNEITTDLYKVYPNPTYDKLWIESIGLNIQSVQVVDVLGRTVIDIQGNQHPEFGIDVSILPKGIYTLVLNSNQEKSYPVSIYKK